MPVASPLLTTILVLLALGALNPNEARLVKFFGQRNSSTSQGVPITRADEGTLPDEMAEMLKFLMSIGPEMADEEWSGQESSMLEADRGDHFGKRSDSDLSEAGGHSSFTNKDADDFLGKRIVIEGTRQEVGEIVSYSSKTGHHVVQMADGSLMSLKEGRLVSFDYDDFEDEFDEEDELDDEFDFEFEDEPANEPDDEPGDEPLHAQESDELRGVSQKAEAAGENFVLYVIGDTHGNARQLKLSLLATGFFIQAADSIEWAPEAEDDDMFRIYIIGGILDQGVHDLRMMKMIKDLTSHPTVGYKLKFILGSREVLLLELHNTLYDFKTGWPHHQRDFAVMASSSHVSSDVQLQDLQHSLEGSFNDVELRDLRDQVEVVRWLSKQDVIDTWHGVLLVHGGVSMRVWAQAKKAFSGARSKDDVKDGINLEAKLYFGVLQDCFYKLQSKERHSLPCKRKLILICMKKHPQPFFLSAEGSGFSASSGLTWYRGYSALSNAFALTRPSNKSQQPDWSEEMFPGYRRRYVEEVMKNEVLPLRTLIELISCLEPKQRSDAIPSQGLTKDVYLPSGELLQKGVHQVTIWLGGNQVFSDGALRMLSVVDKMKDQWMIKYWANDQILPGAGAPATCEEQARLGAEANVKAMVVGHVTHDFIQKFCQKTPVFAIDTHANDECSDVECDVRPQDLEHRDPLHPSMKRGGIHPYGAQALRLELDPTTDDVRSERSCIFTSRGQHCSRAFIADRHAESADVGQRPMNQV